MMDQSTSQIKSPAAPIDISSRVDSLLSLVQDVRTRVSQIPVLCDLVSDFEVMAKEYILLFDASLNDRSDGLPRDRWLKQHEMMDKLTGEWQLIYSLVSSTELGSSYLSGYKPYVEQAAIDIGVSDVNEHALLIPVFGDGFSLTTVQYSASHISILRLPISVIHSPWELSVIWHEIAGLKVIGLREQIRAFLEKYARDNGLTLPQRPEPGKDPVTELFNGIRSNITPDDALLSRVRDFLFRPNTPGFPTDKIWSPDWFKQLYEDACSVLAFGEVFVPVLETILGSQVYKLTADSRYPDLQTRLDVARRVLALQKGDPTPPATVAEKLTDQLLWAFIQENGHDALPVAFEDPLSKPPVRLELIARMKEFIRKFGDLSGRIHESPLPFGAMTYLDRPTVIRSKLLELFGGSDTQTLLDKPFSPSDGLNFWAHTAEDQWQNMYLTGSAHGPHTVYHYGG
jgi:hypothetical protein